MGDHHCTLRTLKIQRSRTKAALGAGADTTAVTGSFHTEKLLCACLPFQMNRCILRHTFGMIEKSRGGTESRWILNVHKGETMPPIYQ